MMLISTALLLDSNIRNSVCTPAKLPCRRVEVGYEKSLKTSFFIYNYNSKSKNYTHNLYKITFKLIIINSLTVIHYFFLYEYVAH
jgi:hypothetical protein